MIRPALGVLLRAPQILLLVLMAAAMPILGLVLLGLALLSPRGVDLFVLGVLLAVSGPIGGAVLAFLGVPFFAYFGGLFTCGAQACALVNLRGERAGLFTALRAMWRCSGRLLSFVGLAFDDDPARRGRLGWALVVMVAEDISVEAAAERVRVLGLEGKRITIVPESQGGYYGAFIMFFWLLGMAWMIDSGASTTVGVMGRMFGLPAAVGTLIGAVIASLHLIVQATWYLAASARARASLRAG